MIAPRIGWIGALVALLLFAYSGSGSADGGVGHFFAAVNWDKTLKVVNPSGSEFFAIAFQWNERHLGDEETDTKGFLGCEGVVVPSKGMDDSDFAETDDILEESEGEVEHRDYVEVLAVPSSGKKAGKIQKGRGVMLRFRGDTVANIDPKLFKLPDGSSVRADVVDCACDELSFNGVASNLLRKFGIKCP